MCTKTIEELGAQAIQQFVEQNVLLNVSALIRRLSEERLSPAIAEQVLNLCLQVDYPETAHQYGWLKTNGIWCHSENINTYTDVKKLVKEEGLEDIYKEAYEHWIITDGLAEKMESCGEIVDMGFFGLTVWGRTSTGQAIWLDSVIQDVCAGLVHSERSLSI